MKNIGNVFGSSVAMWVCTKFSEHIKNRPHSAMVYMRMPDDGLLDAEIDSWNYIQLTKTRVFFHFPIISIYLRRYTG